MLKRKLKNFINLSCVSITRQTKILESVGEELSTFLRELARNPAQSRIKFVY